MTDSLFGPFKPGSGGAAPDCTDGPVGGVPSTIFSYIQKPSNNDPGAPQANPYSKPACQPYYHSTAQIDQLQVNTNLTGATATFSGTVTAPTFQGNINVQSWKGFDIKHPNKDGHRLRHICMEGPEAGVYIRGKCKGTTITCPPYWQGLVDPETISVHLTPVGSYQELFIESIEWGKRIQVRNNLGGPIECFYTITAQRIDGEPLVVEYEGETPAKYPGSSDQFSISGYDYDVRGQKKK